MSQERFWLENPANLVNRFTILPQETDTFEQKLNAVTRLVLLITIIMVLARWKYWYVFLTVSLIVLVATYLNQSGRDQALGNSDLIEDFDDFTHYQKRGLTASNSLMVEKNQQENQRDAITFAQDIIDALTVTDDAPVETFYEFVRMPAVSV